MTSFALGAVTAALCAICLYFARGCRGWLARLTVSPVDRAVCDRCADVYTALYRGGTGTLLTAYSVGRRVDETYIKGRPLLPLPCLSVTGTGGLSMCLGEASAMLLPAGVVLRADD